MDDEQFLIKLHAIGGMKEVVKEDEYQYQSFRADGDLDYFKERMNHTHIAFSRVIKDKLKADLEYLLSHPCEMSSSETGKLEDYFEMLEDFGVRDPFDLFFRSYEKSSCLKSTLHELNNELMFPSSILGESDQRKWVDFAVRNFKSIPEFDRSWDYKTLDDYLTCEQKRDLLTKYKKDIDTFNDMEIPDCR